MGRSNYLIAAQHYELSRACEVINTSMGDMGYGCYLVGSCLERADFRDVDVRYILKDDAYDHLYKDYSSDGANNGLWTLHCISISTWLKSVTGLPVDFQFQRFTQANADHQGKRVPLGPFEDYPGERPSDLKPVTAGGCS